MTSAWLAVADLHGHPAHLEALLGYVDARLGGAYRLVTLGDYVDNGPDTPGLLDRLIELRERLGARFTPIAGNHDVACLRTLGWPGDEPDERWYAAWSDSYWDPGLGAPEAYGAASAAELAARMPARHVDFLRSLPWYHDTGEYFFVHAGLEAGPIGPQREALAAKRLPEVHRYLPHQLRNKRLATVSDPGWDRVVVSGHTKFPGAPHFITERRWCLSAEIDRTRVLYAAIFPENAIVRVAPDLTVSEAPALP